MTVTDEISSHVLATGFDDLDARTVERVKTRVLDSVGVIAAGIHAPVVDELYDLLKGYGTVPQTAAFFRGEQVDILTAAMTNSFAMRSYDFEAIEAENENQKSSAAHISGTTVPTAFACAERAGATGAEFIAALALGDDIAARLGATTGFDVYGCWDNTGTINGLGAVAIAGKLRGLTADELVNAFGLELNMMGGSQDNINFYSYGFKMPMALTARNAIFAADFAAAGMKGSRDAFGGAKGYYAMFGNDKSTPEILTRGLGEVFYGDVVIKPWSACRATHPSIDAVMQIVQANDVDPEQVDGAFSIIYTAALAVAYKCVRPEYMNEKTMRDPALNRVIEKVSIEPSLPPDEYQTAECDIVMADGTAYHARCDVPKGDIYKSALTEDEILDKFYRNIEFSGAMDRTQADKVVEACKNLDKLESINQLVDLIR